MSTNGFVFLPEGCPFDDPDAEAFTVRVQPHHNVWRIAKEDQYWDGSKWVDEWAMTFDFDTAIAMARAVAGTICVDGRTYSEHCRHRS